MLRILLVLSMSMSLALRSPLSKRHGNFVTINTNIQICIRRSVASMRRFATNAKMPSNAGLGNFRKQRHAKIVADLSLFSTTDVQPSTKKSKSKGDSSLPAIIARGSSPSTTVKLQQASSFRSEIADSISRFSDRDNLAAAWQAKGEHYVSYDTLQYLNEQLASFQSNRDKSEKKELLSELTLTYFARFHNIIREEYQFDKHVVEDRLKSWTNKKLAHEGFTLFGIAATSRGSLFQDRVYRFKSNKDNTNLPYHRFSSGDTVRISTGNPFSEKAIDGIVLDRRAKYLDICVPNSAEIRSDAIFRLDVFVNRISYERMLKALQYFLDSGTDAYWNHPAIPLTRCLRDLILYSYPNSLIRLAKSAGGLQLALPEIMNSKSPVSAEIQAEAELMIQEFQQKSNILKQQLQQRIPYRSQQFPSVLSSTNHLTILENMTIVADANIHSTTTVARAMEFSQKLQVKSMPKMNSLPPSDIQLQHLSASPVFETNSRLKKMSSTLSPVHVTGSHPLKIEEINEAMNLVLSKRNFDLNSSQREALQTALVSPLSLIQGPPGTGKTRCSAAILATLVMANKIRLAKGSDIAKGIKSQKILAAAHSNIATDNILEWLLSMNLKVVRIGRPANIRSHLWNATLDYKIQQQPNWLIAKQQLDETLVKYKQGLCDGKVLGAARQKLAEEETMCVANILHEHDVVVSTTIGAGSDVLREYINQRNSRFATVLIDEAAQCSEAALLPTIIHGCERLILVGDQNQLPPRVNSPKALNYGLGISLFSRLIAAGMQTVLLRQQYRMHPRIAQFSSQEFYNHQVVSQVTAAERPFIRGIHWSADVPILFFHVSPDTFSSDDDKSPRRQTAGFEEASLTSSYCNHQEVTVVLELLERIREKSAICFGDIGVISPYNGQVREIINACRSKGFPVEMHSQQSSWENTSFESSDVRDSIHTKDGIPKQSVRKLPSTNIIKAIDLDNESESVAVAVAVAVDDDMSVIVDNNSIDNTNSNTAAMNDNDSNENDLGLYSIEKEETESITTGKLKEEERLLEIKSIDGFQGREKDLIILSTVRSNAAAAVGFLKDWRRLNVGVTRSKSGLIVVGDANTLRHDVHWRSFIDYCISHKCFREWES